MNADDCGSCLAAASQYKAASPLDIEGGSWQWEEIPAVGSHAWREAIYPWMKKRKSGESQPLALPGAKPCAPVGRSGQGDAEGEANDERREKNSE